MAISAASTAHSALMSAIVIRSAAFFHDGNADAVVGPLDSCVDADHPALYEPVTVDEHVRAKLAGSRVGVRNVAAARESARVLESSR